MLARKIADRKLNSEPCSPECFMHLVKNLFLSLLKFFKFKWTHCVQFAHGAMGRQIDPLSFFTFLPVLHDWCNKGCGMCYPVCGMVHIKEPLLLIGKSSPCGGSGFPLSLSEWSLTICLTPYNRR